MSDTKLVHLVEYTERRNLSWHYDDLGSSVYDEDADLEVEYDDTGDPIVQNHDEVEKYDVVRCLDAESVDEYMSERDVVEPGDTLWRDEFANLERGDAIRV